MNVNYLKMFFAVTAVVLLSSVSIRASELGDVDQVSGEVTWIDLKLGQMQIRSDSAPSMGEIVDYRITKHETRVTNPSDNKFLSIADLHPGQHVTLDVINGQEEKIVRKITADPWATYSFQQAYSETQEIDFETETISWEDRQRAIEAQGASSSNKYASIVGLRGPSGPAGSEGKQGLTGEKGESGVALRGERGEEGPMGPVGERGFTGPRGPAGDLARGSVGEVGPAGPRGQQGEVGRRGEQGNSSAGYAGQRGAAGPQGERGPVGEEGAKGSTLYGPTGPDGYAGVSGKQGAVGEQGFRGNTTDGVAGLSGPSGASGVRGEQGATGYKGTVGQVGYWASYKEFNFYSNETALDTADMKTIQEIAKYMKENPSLQIGIDGTAVRSRDQAVNNNRVSAIRAALIDIGVSPDKISTGSIGDKDLRRKGRIAVLFTTA